MGATITRFTVAGTDYDYVTDEVRVGWEEDRDTYSLLDNSVVTDVRRKRAEIEVTGVFTANNSNASSLGPAELFEEIQTEVRAGNSASIVPDTTESAPNSSTPSLGVVTAADGYPMAASYAKGNNAEERTMRLIGAVWLDPRVTADKDLIDDINSITDPL